MTAVVTVYFIYNGIGKGFLDLISGRADNTFGVVSQVAQVYHVGIAFFVVVAAVVFTFSCASGKFGTDRGIFFGLL